MCYISDGLFSHQKQHNGSTRFLPHPQSLHRRLRSQRQRLLQRLPAQPGRALVLAPDDRQPKASSHAPPSPQENQNPQPQNRKARHGRTTDSKSARFLNRPHRTHQKEKHEKTARLPACAIDRPCPGRLQTRLNFTRQQTYRTQLAAAQTHQQCLENQQRRPTRFLSARHHPHGANQSDLVFRCPQTVAIHRPTDHRS